MKLLYKAITKEGKVVHGEIEAKDINEAAVYLQSREYLPVSIAKVTNRTLFEIFPFLRKNASSDLVVFTRQLASMITSGLTLVEALNILKDQMRDRPIEPLITEMIADIEGGGNFSTSLAKYPDVFSPVYISLVKAAEASGLLDKVLLRLADNLERQEELRATIKVALMYPVIVVIAMFAVIMIMMIFVIPQLSVLYQGLNIQLPLPTRIVIAISNFFQTFWFLIIGLVLLFVFFIRRWHKTHLGELSIDTLMLKLPVFGILVRQTILAEFSRILGLMIGTGNLVVESLRQAANTTGNVLYKNAILEVSRKVEKGVTIGDSMSASSNLFPPILIHMVRVGEETGKLDESLGRVSEYFSREVENSVKTLTRALEPLIIVMLGVGVAFLIISIITPIYGLISSIQ